MIMQDKNNLQIADLILQVDRRARQQAEWEQEVKRASRPRTARPLLLALHWQSRRPFAVQPPPRGWRWSCRTMPRCRSRRTTRTTTRARSSPASITCATNLAAAASSSTISTGRSTSSTSRRRRSRPISTSTARGGRPGLFPKFTFERNFATGLTNFIFDPDYARNGVFYTLHMEDPATAGARGTEGRRRRRARPVRLHDDARGARRRPSTAGSSARSCSIEWKDRNTSNATFEGTARELLRVQHPLPQHPLGEMTFNPAARPGDPDWRVMYLGAGDSRSGEQRDSRRLNPQRLDTLVGKILRIVPDLREHTKHEHRQRERALPHPERQSVRRRSTARARRSGRTACAIRIG